MSLPDTLSVPLARLSPEQAVAALLVIREQSGALLHPLFEWNQAHALVDQCFPSSMLAGSFSLEPFKQCLDGWRRDNPRAGDVLKNVFIQQLGDKLREAYGEAIKLMASGIEGRSESILSENSQETWVSKKAQALSEAAKVMRELTTPSLSISR